MPEQVRYRTKVTQSGIFLVRYRTNIWDAGMPMPALVSSMPMPSYVHYVHNTDHTVGANRLERRRRKVRYL